MCGGGGVCAVNDQMMLYFQILAYDMADAGGGAGGLLVLLQKYYK